MAMDGNSTTSGWYYIKAGAPAGQQVGPLSWEQLHSLAQSGTLTPTDLAWHQSLPQWLPAGQIQGLFPAAAFPAQQPGTYQPYAGQPGPYAAAGPKGRHSWLAWAIPLAVVVLAGAGLGIYFGLFHGTDDGSTDGTVSSRTTTTKTTGGTETTATTDSEATATSESVTTTTTEAGPATWTDLSPAGAVPEARDGHAMVYDPSTGKVILFSGYGFNTAFNDTWLYDPDTNTWTDAAPAGSVPDGGSYAPMVYDPISGRAILFGGWSLDRQLGGTWVYDPIENTWTDLAPAGSAPSARSGHSMAYDPLNDKVILFGGWEMETETVFGDTWSYDPKTNTWTELSPAGSVPPARDGHTMVYAEYEGLIFLFGGYNGTDWLNDLWVYDVAADAWTEIIPAGDLPAPRVGYSMVYDDAKDRLIVFGGYDGNWALGDMWAYEPSTNAWTELTSAGDMPSARASSGMVYDSKSGEVILFGGFDDEAELDDTWSYAP
jgi:N-acetylneuraminic acid mutarotase